MGGDENKSKPFGRICAVLQVSKEERYMVNKVLNSVVNNKC